MGQIKLTVTIIAFNEEKNIARAVSSALFADEVLVIDSESHDATREIASSLGAKVIIQPFLGYGQQKNFAEKHASGDWIFNLDADEEISPELQRAIKELLSLDPKYPPPFYCYKMARLNHYCGRPIRHGGWYPDHNARLYKKGMARWSEPHVHEELKPITAPKEIGLLSGEIFHYSFPTVKSQVQTNILYASLAAEQLVKRKHEGEKGKKTSSLFIFFSLLIRPLIKFIECYFIKLGMLDGIHGLIIAINAAHSMFMKYSFVYLDKKTWPSS